MITLYHHWLSPASRLVRVLLTEKRMEFALRLEKEWERRPEFLTLNPAGEVPVILSTEGKPYSGVRAISEYLEETIPEPKLIPGNAEERYQVRNLVDWFHTKFGSEVTRHLVSEKLLKRFLGIGEPDSEALRCAAHNLKNHLRYIEFLTIENNYLAGGQFTMADAAAAAHITVIDYFGDIRWQDWPGAKAWYSRVKGRRSIQPLLSDRVSGLTPPSHYADIDF
ncbi:glutathione S-transferase family protein [Temperatibacter marinus]|uniref:Glutathione S-transferase family protein n=1 Tax=Temperatibacter marinus TaxID=1456591 RepID=A0AA52EGY1_9PROT|nr:glutathione S-transferase family protein [Temperatibacter marinus]WND03463.1 glutathione S-transferase family protein [Temperatibacter marinus]